MNRVLEEDVLFRCSAAARGTARARNALDANTFLLASMVLQSRLPNEARCLKHESEAYFVSHPSEKVPVQEAMGKSWVTSLPRLRDTLTAHLKHPAGATAPHV